MVKRSSIRDEITPESLQFIVGRQPLFSSTVLVWLDDMRIRREFAEAPNNVMVCQPAGRAGMKTLDSVHYDFVLWIPRLGMELDAVREVGEEIEDLRDDRDDIQLGKLLDFVSDWPADGFGVVLGGVPFGGNPSDKFNDNWRWYAESTRTAALHWVREPTLEVLAAYWRWGK